MAEKKGYSAWDKPPAQEASPKPKGMLENIRESGEKARRAREAARDARKGRNSAAASTVSSTAMPSGTATGSHSSPAPSKTSTPKLYSGAPMAAADRGVPKTPPVYSGDAVAASFRKGQAVGARKMATKAAKPKAKAKAADTTVKGFTPSPSGTKRPGLLERNKANIQAKALERMKKSGRKG